MADWQREIELQKLYGMSPVEAMYFSEREDGLTTASIAEVHGTSVCTVRNLIQKGLNKMRTSGRKITEMDWKGMVTVLVGDMGNVRDAVKFPAAYALIRFASELEGTEPQLGKYVVMAPFLNREGDVQWMWENVLRFCSLEGMRMQEVDAMVEKMLRLYREANGTPDRMGMKVLVYWLDRWYMRYDVWEVE